MNKIARFLQKSPHEKAATVMANVKWTSRHLNSFAHSSGDWARMLPWARLRHTDFHSGLGDSCYLLYGLARSMKPKICVEIGSARGKSACYVGMALKENGGGKLIAIDPHTQTDWNDSKSNKTLSIMRHNIRKFGLEDQIEIKQQTSSEAASSWPHPIDMIFIDGDHTYEGVKRDWELFLPYLTEFGIVIFHDTAWDLPAYHKDSRSDMGVPRFLEELRRDGYPVITINRDYGVSLVQPIRGGHPLSVASPRTASVSF